MAAVKPVSASRTRSKGRRVPLSQEKQEMNRIPVRQSLPFTLLLLFSGAAALIYQVLWIRQLSLVVGIEVYSITVAVSAFFAGLAAGGAVFGRLAHRWTCPLLLYSLLEAGVALFGVSVTIALAHSAEPFVALQTRAGLLAWLLPFLLVGAPAFLMGGTLPVAMRSLAVGPCSVALTGGWVYGANTAGGIAGALLSSFALLPRSEERR